MENIGPLFTDLYELTMGAAYFDHGHHETATFSLFIRGGKKRRGYYVAAGLAEVLQELESLSFRETEIGYLQRTGLFSDSFLSHLQTLGFSGSVRAMPEGTIFFPEEPILEITAPIIEAQLVETMILNIIGFSTLIATKAARCVSAAEGRPLVDFSLRRTQGWDAGLKVARSSYIAGFTGTSNLLAGQRYGIPVSGTMAHSYVEAFESEADAFLAYGRTFPENCIFLIDTYDTLEGARSAVRVAKIMAKENRKIVGVRLDSGDMVTLSREVRQILDAAELPYVKIFASSGFDEYKIRDVLSRGGKIDAFGVGTRMGVSADAPYLDIVYKMVKFGDRLVRKLSPGKATFAGEKQVFRKLNAEGSYLADVVGVREEEIDNAQPLLIDVMENGQPLLSPQALPDIRARFKENISRLDGRYQQLADAPDFPVSFSPRLLEIQPDPFRSI